MFCDFRFYQDVQSLIWVYSERVARSQLKMKAKKGNYSVAFPESLPIQIK